MRYRWWVAAAPLLALACMPLPHSSSDFMPAWTENGARLLFASIPFENGDSEIWGMEHNGLDRQRLTSLQRESARSMAAAGFHSDSARGLRLYPSVSPDGRTVAFVSVRRGPKVVAGVLYRMDLTTREATVLFDSKAQRVGPSAWSPDGRQVAFATDAPDNMYELWVVDAAGGEARRLTKNRFHTWSPSWAPARQIVFAGNRRSDGSIAPDPGRAGHWELFLLDPTSGQVEGLTDNGDDDFSPAWDPDGDEVAFVTHAQDEWRLNVMQVASRRTRTVFRSPTYIDHPSWHPSGREIAITRGSAPRFEGYFMDLEVGSVDIASGRWTSFSGTRAAR
jgi:Tol biopolymer transport system component